MSKRGKILLQPGFLGTHVRPEYERERDERIKKINEICKSQGVKGIVDPCMRSVHQNCANEIGKHSKVNVADSDYSPSSDDDLDDDDNESIDSFEQEAIEMPLGCQNVRAHRDTPSPPQNVTPSHPQRLTPSPHTPSSPQTVTPPPPQGLTSSPPPTQGLTTSPTPTIAQSPQVNGRGPSSSLKRVRGPTVGKSLDKIIAHNGGKKLVVTVPEEMKAFCGVNATVAATDLGVQIRRFCPIEGFAHSWKSVDSEIKKAVLQSNLDKFDIIDGIEGNPLAYAVIDKKASLLYKNWKCTMRRHYRKLRKSRVDLYSNPYPGVSEDEWKYLVDHIFKDPKVQKRCRAGKKNRENLSYNHTMGSKSFPAAMSIEAEGYDLCNFFKRSHTLKKTKEWIKPTCAVLHVEMEKVRDEALQSGVSVTHEEFSIKVLGKGKNPNYLRGLGVGPMPSSLSFKSHIQSQAHAELISMRSEMELIRKEQRREREVYELEREERDRERKEERDCIDKLESLVTKFMDTRATPWLRSVLFACDGQTSISPFCW